MSESPHLALIASILAGVTPWIAFCAIAGAYMLIYMERPPLTHLCHLIRLSGWVLAGLFGVVLLGRVLDDLARDTEGQALPVWQVAAVALLLFVAAYTAVGVLLSITLHVLVRRRRAAGVVVADREEALSVSRALNRFRWIHAALLPHGEIVEELIDDVCPFLDRSSPRGT